VSYTSVFGGNTIYPSDVSFLAVALTADIELEWPLESSGELPPAARIIDVTPDASGWDIVLPDATLTGAGQTIFFNNLSGSRSFFVKDFAGNTLATVAFGEQWQVYLAATTTAAGTWRVFRYGASTATVQPSSLAGFGLTVTDSTLSQSLPVTTFSTTGITVATSNRASAFVWTATGSGTLNLLTAASAGNNFFVFVRNEGGGDLVVEPAGSETINSGPNLTLRPGDSATVITDGAEWYTIGLGQQAVFAFDYTIINVTGGTVTLSGSQLNRIAYRFEGTLTSNCTIVVPPTVQQYWITNATTGAFNLFVRTSAGTPTQVNQGAKGIYYCDGTEMVLASDPTTLTTPIVISDGGTGATTASGARLNIGITSFADAIVTATTGASVRTTIAAAKSGANTDITSMGALTSIVGNLSLVGDVLIGGGGDLNISSATGGNASGFYNDAQDLYIRVNASTRAYISSTGLFGIGTTAPKTTLQSTAGGYLNAPVLGSATGAPFYVTNADTAYGLLVGVNSADGRAWLQSQRTDGTASSGPITLNEAGGNVGVGIVPTVKFDVNGRGRFMQDAAATTGAIVIRQNVGDTVGGFIQWVNNAANIEKGWLNVDTSSNMIFATVSSERLRITSAGDVGIGTSSPSTKLDVSGAIRTGAGATDPGTGGVMYIVGSGAFQTVVAGAAFAVNTGANNARAERMRIDASGNVGIGTATPANKLEVAGDIRLASGGDLKISAAVSGNDMALYNENGDLYFNNGTQRMFLSAAGNLAVGNNITAGGDITATGNVTAYSDAKLKTELSRIEGALDKVEKLAGYVYTRTDSGERQTGLLAQDVQAVLPEAVVNGEYLSVAYGNMMGLVVEAIKELRAELNELREQAVRIVHK
jgi:hypothetical protein